MQRHPRLPKTISELKTIHGCLKVNFNPANGPHLSGFKRGYLCKCVEMLTTPILAIQNKVSPKGFSVSLKK